MYEILSLLEEVLVPVAICVILSISIVAIVVGKKRHEMNKRTEILLAAIEKNAELDVDEYLRKMSPNKKTIKERLITKLLWGSVLSALGFALLVYSLWMDILGGMLTRTLQGAYMSGATLLLVGLAIILVFFISKKMLANEMKAEAEQKN